MNFRKKNSQSKSKNVDFSSKFFKLFLPINFFREGTNFLKSKFKPKFTTGQNFRKFEHPVIFDGLKN